MKRISIVVLAAAAAACAIASRGFTAGGAGDQGSPIYGITIPAGYRQWELISIAHEAGDFNDLRAVLGNAVAVKAARDGTLPFPDGAIIARLAWKHTPSAANNKVFGREQSFVAGDATNVQFMVKDATKYAATGGWGFAHFNKDGTSGDEALLKTCSPCHAKASRDSVFTQYAPSY